MNVAALSACRSTADLPGDVVSVFEAMRVALRRLSLWLAPSSRLRCSDVPLSSHVVDGRRKQREIEIDGNRTYDTLQEDGRYDLCCSVVVVVLSGCPHRLPACSSVPCPTRSTLSRRVLRPLGIYRLGLWCPIREMVLTVVWMLRRGRRGREGRATEPTRKNLSTKRINTRIGHRS
jgi:hypothetical protein